MARKMYAANDQTSSHTNEKLFGLSIAHDTLEIPLECLRNRSEKIRVYRDGSSVKRGRGPAYPNCVLIENNCGMHESRRFSEKEKKND